MRCWPSLRCTALAGDDFPMTAGEQIHNFLSYCESDSHIAASHYLFLVLFC